MRKRLSKIKIEWTPSFAYCLGLIATDGNLSPDERHLNMTSKDLDLITLFCRNLSLTNKIGCKANGTSPLKKYYVVQFGDVNFFNFLLSLGFTPAKSKTIGPLSIPLDFFADFLRGCIDGDGNISVSTHPESKNPQLRLRLCSASMDFLVWVKEQILLGAKIETGWIYSNANNTMHILSFGKSDSLRLFRYMYYTGVESYLPRKYELAKKFL